VTAASCESHIDEWRGAIQSAIGDAFIGFCSLLAGLRKKNSSTGLNKISVKRRHMGHGFAVNLVHVTLDLGLELG